MAVDPFDVQLQTILSQAQGRVKDQLTNIVNQSKTGMQPATPATPVQPTAPSLPPDLLHTIGGYLDGLLQNGQAGVGSPASQAATSQAASDVAANLTPGLTRVLVLVLGVIFLIGGVVLLKPVQSIVVSSTKRAVKSAIA